MKAYQNDNIIRSSFNHLSRSIFDLDFEDWYKNGYWKENYIPYSVLDGDRVMANVSISSMKFIHDGKVINVIQLGTVMTEESHRKQGLIRQLIKEIKEDDTTLFVKGEFLEIMEKNYLRIPTLAHT